MKTQLFFGYSSTYLYFSNLFILLFNQSSSFSTTQVYIGSDTVALYGIYAETK